MGIGEQFEFERTGNIEPEKGLEQPPNQEVANVCPSCGHDVAVYSIMAKGWVCKACKWFLRGNAEL